MEQAQLRQLILPTDKRNPCFTLYRTGDGAGGSAIQVYYGLELMEVVADSRDDPLFRCMVARLYNGGVKLKSLVEVFDLDPKTIRSWGAALQSRDPARMQAALFGPRAARKKTDAIVAYVSARLPELLARKCRNFRVTLQLEIAKIFDVRLSGETLRIIIAGVKSLPPEVAAELENETLSEPEPKPEPEPGPEPEPETHIESESQLPPAHAEDAGVRLRPISAFSGEGVQPPPSGGAAAEAPLFSSKSSPLF